jgi:hypothetical protein
MERWPELPYAAWKDTSATLQLWTQIVGKTLAISRLLPKGSARRPSSQSARWL